MGKREWSAEIVCKCLQKCAYDAYDYLDLQEECQYEECGKVSDEVIAHYNEPALCNPLREQARADLDALKEKLGIVTPSRWAKFCGSNHEGVTPYAAGAYKSYTKQPSNHGANLEQRHLSTDNSVEGERERMRIS